MAARSAAYGADAYAALVTEAEAAVRRGWDFSFLAGRVRDVPLPWSYPELAAAELRTARRVVDVDTGGGELLAELLTATPVDRAVVAVEPYAPNVPVATDRLRPYGVEVWAREGVLPVADGWADLVLNRHGALDPVETARILAPGGRLLTQQVGSDNDGELNAALSGPPSAPVVPTLAVVVDRLGAAGLRIETAVEARPRQEFLDVGAVVFQLLMVPWQVQGFDPERYDRPLRRLHAHLAGGQPLAVTSHRYLVRAARS